MTNTSTENHEETISQKDRNYIYDKFKLVKLSKELADEFIAKYGSKAKALVIYAITKPNNLCQKLNQPFMNSSKTLQFLLKEETLDAGLIASGVEYTKYNAKTSKIYDDDLKQQKKKEKKDKKQTVQSSEPKTSNYSDLFPGASEDALHLLEEKDENNNPLFTTEDIQKIQSRVNHLTDEYMNTPEANAIIEERMSKNVNTKNDESKVDYVCEYRKSEFLEDFPKLKREDFKTEAEYHQAVRDQYIAMQNKRYEYGFYQSSLSEHATVRCYTNFERRETSISQRGSTRISTLETKNLEYIAPSDSAYTAPKVTYLAKRSPTTGNPYHDCASSGALAVSYASSTNMGSFDNTNIIMTNTSVNQGVGHHREMEQDYGDDISNYSELNGQAKYGKRKKEYHLNNLIENGTLRAGDTFSVQTGEVTKDSSGHHFLTIADVKRGADGKIISYTIVDFNGAKQSTRTQVCYPDKSPDPYNNTPVIYSRNSLIKEREFQKSANNLPIEEIIRRNDIIRQEVAGDNGLLDKTARTEKEVLFATGWTKQCEPGHKYKLQAGQTALRKEYYKRYNAEIRANQRDNITEELRQEVLNKHTNKEISVRYGFKRLAPKKSEIQPLKVELATVTNAEIKKVEVQNFESMTYKIGKELLKKYKKDLKSKKKYLPANEYAKELAIVKGLEKDNDNRKKIEKIFDKIIKGKAKDKDFAELMKLQKNPKILYKHAQNYFAQENKKPNEQELTNWNNFLASLESTPNSKDNLKESMATSARNTNAVFDKTKSTLETTSNNQDLPQELSEAYENSITLLPQLAQTYDQTNTGSTEQIMVEDKKDKDNLSLPTSVSDIVANDKKTKSKKNKSKIPNTYDYGKYPRA